LRFTSDIWKEHTPMTHSIKFDDCINPSEFGDITFAIDHEENDGVYINRSKGNEERFDIDLAQVKHLIAFLQQVVVNQTTAAVETTDAAPKRRRHYSALSPQAQTIYQHMRRAGSISAREAMEDYGITSATLARRICDISAEGFSVLRDNRVHPMTGKRYTRYSLTAV